MDDKFRELSRRISVVTSGVPVGGHPWVAELIDQMEPEVVAALASKAAQSGMRHAPLVLFRYMATNDKCREFLLSLVDDLFRRPDFICWVLGLYYQTNPTRRLPMQFKKALKKAWEISNWSEATLGRYRKGANGVSLRRSLAVLHPVPQNRMQAELWGKLRRDTIAVPQTVLTVLSNPDMQSRKRGFEQLLAQGAVGTEALLRNLAAMHNSGVSPALIHEALDNASMDYLMPYQVLRAAYAQPAYSTSLLNLLKRSLQRRSLTGATVVGLDISGSMGDFKPGDEMFIAVSLAICALMVSDESHLWLLGGDDLTRVGKFGLYSAPSDLLGWGGLICKARKDLGTGGIFTRQFVEMLRQNPIAPNLQRLIIISDSADCDLSHQPAMPFTPYSYIINVATDEQLSGNWTLEVSGPSSNFIDAIQSIESLEASL